jgi:hypothetical protein
VNIKNRVSKAENEIFPDGFDFSAVNDDELMRLERLVRVIAEGGELSDDEAAELDTLGAKVRCL